jgi:protease-4
MDSPLQPFTPDQWTNLNHQADVIYDDFTRKVADGRKLPLDKVQTIARGRVWSGADAQERGLVDSLGGFWTAAGQAAALGHVAEADMAFRTYPRPTGLWGSLERLSGGLDASVHLFGRIEALMNLPGVQALETGVTSMPQGGAGSGVRLEAGPLPKP